MISFAETVSWNLSASKKTSLKRELPKRTAKKAKEGCWHWSSPSSLQIVGFRNHLIGVGAVWWAATQLIHTPGLPLPAALLLLCPQKQHNCLPSVVGPFLEAERSDSKVFVYRFPCKLGKQQAREQAELTVQAECGLGALSKSLLWQFSIDIWLKSACGEIRGNGEHLSGQRVQWNQGRCFFTTEFCY